MVLEIDRSEFEEDPDNRRLSKGPDAVGRYANVAERQMAAKKIAARSILI